MGYYLNTLIQGEQYELNGQKLEFYNKANGLFYFYRYVYDEDNFNHKKTNELVSFTFKELNYLKRIQQCSPHGSLRPIGRDKVWKPTNSY